MSNLKYLTVVNKLGDNIIKCLKEVPRRGGFFNWLFLFKGDIMEYNQVDDFEKYDVVHLNGPPSDQVLVPEIRRRLGRSSDTKLVLNNDHVCEVWDKWNIHPLHYLNAQRDADMIFGTEEHQVSNMLPNAHVIPHPHWIHMLKRHGRTDVRDTLGFMHHWWENKDYVQALWCHRLKQDGIDMKPKLYGYVNKGDDWVNKSSFDELVQPMTHPDFVDSFIKNKVVSDMCYYHTYGRTTVDCAAIGVPMVGSNRIASMRHCFPDLAIDPTDYNAFKQKLKLLQNDKYYDEVVDLARAKSEFYNYANSKQRFLAALDECDAKC